MPIFSYIFCPKSSVTHKYYLSCNAEVERWVVYNFLFEGTKLLDDTFGAAWFSGNAGVSSMKRHHTQIQRVVFFRDNFCKLELDLALGKNLQ